VECGDFVLQIHKRRECTVLTLSFLEQADTFAVGEQKDKQKENPMKNKESNDVRLFCRYSYAIWEAK
jgi:hypothetical protein